MQLDNHNVVKDKSNVVNQDLVVINLWDPEKSWYELIRNVFNDASEIENILKIYIPCVNRDDMEIWVFSIGANYPQDLLTDNHNSPNNW